jgi:hypothetical protein
MSFLTGRVGLVRAGLLALTIAAAFGLLAIGQETREIDLIVNGVSPKTFQVDPTGEPIEVEDPVLTASERAAARAAVDLVTSVNPGTNQLVLADIQEVFDTVRDGVFLPPDQLNPPTTVPVPDITTTTTSTTQPPDTTVGTGETTTTTSTLPPEPVTTTVSGLLFIDADDIGVDANGTFDPEEGDLPLSGVDVSITDFEGVLHETATDSLGNFSLVGIPATSGSRRNPGRLS